MNDNPFGLIGGRESAMMTNEAVHEFRAQMPFAGLRDLPLFKGVTQLVVSPRMSGQLERAFPCGLGTGPGLMGLEIVSNPIMP